MMKLDKDLLLVCKSAGLGDGEPDLGEQLMRAFLTMLLESGRVPAKCLFVNSGIFLSTEGSSVLDLLQQLEAAGAKILSCGTCLEYYQRKDKLVVGERTTMRDTVEAMLSFGKVLSP